MPQRSPPTAKTEQGRARTPLRAVVAKRDTLAAARRGLRALPLPGHFLVTRHAAGGAKNAENGASGRWRAASWTAPVPWRFRPRIGWKSGRGLPHSKTLRADRADGHFLVRQLAIGNRQSAIIFWSI